MKNILENLNDKQLEAVQHHSGPMLVIAGAGSGKTRALTHRIAYLIKHHKVNPWNILAVTFTNKAANEMKNRVVKLLSDHDELAFMETFGDLFEAGEMEKLTSSNIPTIGTFHSICVRILRKNIHLMDFENSFAIYDTADQQIVMKRLMDEAGMDTKKTNPKAVLAHISNAKNQLMGPKEFEGYANDYFSEKVAKLYPKYQNALQTNNALDFDDIIMKTVILFQKFPDILDKYQEKFKFISVDEYQDTNKAQFVLIELLASKYKNLTVIGDSDQSIYGWRGATIQNILDFEKHYPETRTIKLEQNYRSTQIILDASNGIISKNIHRTEKSLWTNRTDGDLIKRLVASNERHEAELISKEIKNLLVGSEYPKYNDFVVLYRTNAQSRVIEEVFLRYAIPYKIVGGIRFYQRKEIKDIIAYLRLIQNQNDSVSLLRIINTPTRKIGATTLVAISNFATSHNMSLYNALLLADEIPGLSASKKETIEKFIKLIVDLQSKNAEFSASGMIKHVLDQTGYKGMLKEDNSVEAEARLENIYELISVAQKYDNLNPGMSLNIFLEEVSLIADIDSMESGDNAVTLMTIHSAKGLEFPVVFVAGLEEGIFPHNRSLVDQTELEEERRLMYVAMTRAKDKLYLLHAKQRMLYGESKSNIPSQFLDDIGEELIESNIELGGYQRSHFALENLGEQPVPFENEESIDIELGVGDKISHASFGNGIVIDLKGGVVTVAFEDSRAGVKKLAISIAPLKKI